MTLLRYVEDLAAQGSLRSRTGVKKRREGDEGIGGECRRSCSVEMVVVNGSTNLWLA